MGRYIDADILRAYMNRYGFKSKDMTITEFIENILPTADVRENVHGEWINKQLIPGDITGHMHGECSVCHKVRVISNFCPNCNADMRESVRWKWQREPLPTLQRVIEITYNN